MPARAACSLPVTPRAAPRRRGGRGAGAARAGGRRRCGRRRGGLHARDRRRGVPPQRRDRGVPTRRARRAALGPSGAAGALRRRLRLQCSRVASVVRVLLTSDKAVVAGAAQSLNVGTELGAQGCLKGDRRACISPALRSHEMCVRLPQAMIDVLGLDVCADTIIGNAMRRGVSGGQKKRVTTGAPPSHHSVSEAVLCVNMSLRGDRMFKFRQGCWQLRRTGLLARNAAAGRARAPPSYVKTSR